MWSCEDGLAVDQSVCLFPRAVLGWEVPMGTLLGVREERRLRLTGVTGTRGRP